MAALDTFLDRCEAFAAPLFGALAGSTGGGVYVVKKTGRRLSLPPGTLIETARMYPVESEQVAGLFMDLVDIDIPAHLLTSARGIRLVPAVGDQVIREFPVGRDVCVVCRPKDRQCYEAVGSYYVRVHCERRPFKPDDNPPPAPGTNPPDGHTWAHWVRDEAGRIKPYDDN